MKKRQKKRSIKSGLPPGTPVYTGILEKETEIFIIDYDLKNYQEIQIKDLKECFAYKDKPTISWINIVGLYNTDVIEKIGKGFHLHPLVIEDILNIHQRPKIEYFEDYIFIVLKMLTYNKDYHEVESEQVSIILGKNFVLTFQERRGDVFDPIRNRIKISKGLIRKYGADYLVYALMDVIVDNYFVILEEIGEDIEGLEDKVVLNPSSEVVHSIHKLKGNLIVLRKSIWPLREILSTLEKTESHLIKNIAVYLRDVYDHTIQVIDTIETFRDLATGMLDIYLSSVSNRMNETMKVLTIIATIFMPLTFIAGIYGMNFKYMPELEWKWGYPLVLIVMLGIGVMMALYFRKKKWL